MRHIQINRFGTAADGDQKIPGVAGACAAVLGGAAEGEPIGTVPDRQEPAAIQGGVRAQSAQLPVMRKQIGADRLFQLVPGERHSAEGVVIALKPHFITVVQRRDAEHGVL